LVVTYDYLILKGKVMAQIATSLKLPGDLKERLDLLAKESGASSHAYMLSALQAHAERAELAQQFLQDAIAADEAMRKSNVGYAAQDVHAYLTERAKGNKAKRPRAKSWRK
jgi:predicted transcriptional regulator